MELLPWNVIDTLETSDDIAAYLEAVFEDGDPALITKAIGDVARSKGMTAIAEATGTGRESLYKALSGNRDPRFTTILKVLDALNLKLVVAAKPETQANHAA